MIDQKAGANIANYIRPEINNLKKFSKIKTFSPSESRL